MEWIPLHAGRVRDLIMRAACPGRCAIRDLRGAPAVLATLVLWLTAAAAAAAADPADAKPSRDARIDALPPMIAEAFAAPGRGGTVLVAKDEEVVFRGAYGSADLELGVPMRPDHVLGIGSITKQMTAVAILKLAEEGRLSLEDDVRKYWPAIQTHGRAITIAQVLTHTSGLANFVDRDDFGDISRRDLGVAQILALNDDVPLRFEPGSGYHYSDSGYILLGAIIESVSGRPYGDYMEAELFRPLGMRDTWHADDARIIPRRARGYTVAGDGPGFANAGFISMHIPRAAGGVFSTVDDLARWEHALRTGRIVGLPLLRRAWTAQVLPDGTPTGHGFAWKLCEVGGSPTREQGGFINGFSANLLVLPDDGWTIAVLVNNDADAPDAGVVARRIARLLATGDPEPARVALGPSERARLTGRYQVVGEPHVRTILERDGTLFSRVDDGPERELFAISPTVLARSDGDGDGDGAYAMHFVLDTAGSGQATGYAYALRCSIANERGQRLPTEQPMPPDT